MKTAHSLYRNILIVLIIFLSAIGLYFTHIAQDVIVPIVFAIFTAFLLHPFVIRLNSLKIPYFASVIVVYAVYILLFAAVIFLLSGSIASLFTDLPRLIKALQIKAANLFKLFSDNPLIKKIIDFNNLKKSNNTDPLITPEGLTRQIIHYFNLIFTLGKSFIIYGVSLLFILPGMDKLPDNILKAVPGDKGKKINKIIVEIILKLQNYVFTKFIISFVIGIVSLIICFIFRIKYPFLWAFLIFILNFIPLIGTFIALSLTMLMHFIQYQSLWYFVLLYACLMSIQIIMENVIQPQILSETVNLSPIIVIISIVLWVYIWGFSGFLLAVPVTSALNIIFQNIKELKPISIFMSKKY